VTNCPDWAPSFSSDNGTTHPGIHVRWAVRDRVAVPISLEAGVTL
jgi:hypothetical protein